MLIPINPKIKINRNYFNNIIITFSEKNLNKNLLLVYERCAVKVIQSTDMKKQVYNGTQHKKCIFVPMRAICYKECSNQIS